MNESSRQPASVVAPAPYGTIPVEGAALRMLAHHAARGYAFWLSVADPGTSLLHLATAEAGVAVEWLLARAWFALVRGYSADGAAAEIAYSSARPEEFGEDFHGFCVMAGVDPDRVAPAFPAFPAFPGSQVTA